MTLKLTLKPGEGVFIGGSRVEILARGISTLLISGDMAAHHDEYFDLARRLLMEDATALDWITETNKCLIVGDVYKAIKLAREKAWRANPVQLDRAS